MFQIWSTEERGRRDKGSKSEAESSDIFWCSSLKCFPTRSLVVELISSVGLWVSGSHSESHTVPRQKFSRNRVISEKRVLPTLILLYSSLHHIMLQTPLASISSNRSKGPDLHPHKRGFLLGLTAGDATPSKIFHAYRVPESTTRSTIALASQRVNKVSQPRTGRLNLLSVRNY